MSKLLRTVSMIVLALALLLSLFVTPAMAQGGESLFLPYVGGTGSAGMVNASAGGALIAQDMVCSTSQNLVSYENRFTDAFSSAGDGFQKYQRGVSASIPFAIMDDSLSIFPTDNLGIVKEVNTEEFCGATDTQNDDNNGPVSAVWTFNISGESDIVLSVDMGAMGDFESSDTFVWSYQIDGGSSATAFASSVDEDGSQTYTLEGGSSYTLADPMLVDGTLLSNNLQTFTTSVVGSGDQLVLTLTLQTDGGSEAMAFQNIVISSGGTIGPVDCSTPPPPPIETAKIHDVQGNGAVSPLVGEVVRVEAIVVGDYQGLADGTQQLGGFFVQEEDGDVDGEASTSEGIFVYCDSCPTAVSVGDMVQVTGKVGEYFGMTQIDAKVDSDVIVLDSESLPTPAVLDLPIPDATDIDDFYEPFEGMLVKYGDRLTVAEYFELSRYGQLLLSEGGRPYQFTHSNAPSVDGYSDHLDEVARRTVILDDDNNFQNDALFNNRPVYWPRAGFSVDNIVRGGYTIDNLTGVLHWSYAGQRGTDAWRIRPVLEAYDYSFDSTPNPRTATPQAVVGELKVASFNVLNYFTTIDDGSAICGPTGGQGCRGADSAAEFERQRAKIVSALVGLDADIVGLVEMENSPSDAPVVDLVNGLNDAMGAGTYDYIATGPIGGDAIRVGLIYKPASVSPAGDYAVLDSSVDPRFIDTKNRPALAQTFVQNSDGSRMTAVVNHLKSKGSSCDDVGDPDLNDGQANCNVTRTDAAAALADWLATDPTDSGDPDYLILGDLNSYAQEDPIMMLAAQGFTDLLADRNGPEAYTYVFDGQLGYLDYAMANSSLASQVQGVSAWHINADEVNVLDYNDEVRDPTEASFEPKPDALPLYGADAYRASDHDPVLVGFELNASPVCDAAVPSLDTLWPVNHKMVPVSILGVTDAEEDAITITIDFVYQDEPVNGDGDGDTSPDAQGIGTDTVELRAERAGTGNGRVYHVSFTASDATGSCTGEVLVSAPKSSKGTAIDDGPNYDSTDGSAVSRSIWSSMGLDTFLPFIGKE